MRARAIAALIAASPIACAWPAGYSPRPAPAAEAGPLPVILASARTGPAARADAAVIVALAQRPQAHAMAEAWYRHLRVALRVDGPSIHLLRDAEVTPKRLYAAIERARWQVGEQGTLWFVFIGDIDSPTPGQYGVLQLHAGEVAEIDRVLSRLQRGRHTQGVAVLDGCTPGAALPGTATPARLPFTAFAPREAVPTIVALPQPTESVAARTAGPLNISRRAVQAQIHLASSRREPVDLAVFSAGVGPGCVAQIPANGMPALSYLLLGALRGWADLNADIKVTTSEALGFVRAAARSLAGAAAAPQVYGAELVLAEPARERSPISVEVTPDDNKAWTREPMARFDRGWYRMGCRGRTEGCERDERPAHRVFTSRFFLDRLEVTQAEYQQCVDAGSCTAIDAARCFVWTGSEFKRGAQVPAPLLLPDRPVVCVTWQQAQNYCHALGKRLPSEAEWERAAAGPEQRRYPWGDTPPTCDHARQDGCGEHTAAVGTAPAGRSPDGILDLAGNASEWTHDWYGKDNYYYSQRVDPHGPRGGIVKVVRGGSYYDGPTTLRSGYRYGLNPASSFTTVGFRCAR